MAGLEMSEANIEKPPYSRRGRARSCLIIGLLFLLCLLMTIWVVGMYTQAAELGFSNDLRATSMAEDASLRAHLEQVVEMQATSVTNLEIQIAAFQGSVNRPTVQFSQWPNWEYLTLNYLLHDHDGDRQLEEVAETSNEAYSQTLFSAPACFSFGSTGEDECWERRENQPVRGLLYYVQELGADGWELVNIETDLNPYALVYPGPLKTTALTFKRPDLDHSDESASQVRP